MIQISDRAVNDAETWGARTIMGSSGLGCIASPAPAGMMARMSTLDESLEARLEADIRAVAERGDRAAFARIFAFYGPRVKAYLRRLGAEDAVAEDLTQDVLLAIWRRAQQFDRSRAALSTWVYTIARNKRIDALRRERRPDFDPEDPALVGDIELAPRGDRFAESEQARRAVMQAVEKLPAAQAQLLRIFYFDEKPHSVIADELGLPLGTVKSRLRLALSKLRLLLNGMNE
jgi:RNA polymerase sigma-70 factor (ECF subfamily)